MFGISELLKPNNPAFRGIIITIMTVGNELQIWQETGNVSKKDGKTIMKRHWETENTLTEEIKEL